MAGVWTEELEIPGCVALEMPGWALLDCGLTGPVAELSGFCCPWPWFGSPCWLSGSSGFITGMESWMPPFGSMGFAFVGSSEHAAKNVAAVTNERRAIFLCIIDLDAKTP